MTTQRDRSSQAKALRLWVLDRDRWLCQINGPRCTHVATCVDHVVPVADGGAEHDARNMRASCVPCNARLSAQRTNARRKQTDRYRYRNGVPEYLTRF